MPRRQLILTGGPRHYVTAVGRLPKALRDRREKLDESGNEEQKDGEELGKRESGRKDSTHTARATAKDVFSIRVSFQCGPDIFEFLVQHPTSSQKLSRTFLAPIDEGRV